MGSFLGHLLPGTLFLLVGLWHIFSSVFNYVSHPRSFKVRAWHPIPRVKGRLKYLELYIIMVGSFVDMCIEFLYSTHLTFIVDGALNPHHMNDFEHAAMLLMFFIFSVACFISETTGLLPLPEGMLFILGGMAFTAEYLLFYFHSTSHAGLEGRYHQLLVILIGLCIIAAALGAAFRESFVVDILGGIAITLQGTWFYETAFVLYGPKMPEGCRELPAGIVCDSPEQEMIGQSHANSTLSAHIVTLLCGLLLFYALAARVWGHSDLYGGYSVSKGPSGQTEIDELSS
ncbi:hypothetical protein R1sor_008058 [Riccia sorocarpa]|uniref:Transmembrane protein 45B n=1 Tax=Riccia sorocarpa TaxID=122646 RepID=A0ABD3HVR9_9MARC